MDTVPNTVGTDVVMDRDTAVCANCDSLVPLADNVRPAEGAGTFICPVCHQTSPVGPLGREGYEQDDVEPVEQADGSAANAADRGR